MIIFTVLAAAMPCIVSPNIIKFNKLRRQQQLQGGHGEPIFLLARQAILNFNHIYVRAACPVLEALFANSGPSLSSESSPCWLLIKGTQPAY
jgi:hypothetical protein